MELLTICGVLPYTIVLMVVAKLATVTYHSCLDGFNLIWVLRSICSFIQKEYEMGTKTRT